MVLLLYCDKMYLVPEALVTSIWSRLGLHAALVCAGYCRAFTGWAKYKVQSKFVHILILLLSNQVENKSGVSGWVGERGKRFPCFPSCGISVSKNIHVFCYTIVVTLVCQYIVVLGVYCVLAEVGMSSAFQNLLHVCWHTLLENAFVCYVMLDWSSEDMIRFSLCYLCCYWPRYEP